ncbi:TSUP family transporter [Lysobacter yangpyeongensis]|uniref:Probable membrane transporter protein n=1 Tax=Lysobacter yangpyeongensis TaxID=346182 RepID=A0ABW0SN10_9GAMM
MDLGVGTVALLTGAAFVAGVVDTIAGGGGLLTIPALMAAGVPPVSAIATSKVQSAFCAASAVHTFARSGRIDLRSIVRPAIGASVGAVLGGAAVQFVDPAFLTGLVPVLLVMMAGYFAFAPRVSDEDRHARFNARALLATATAIGFYDGFFGPGTGSFLAAALVAWFGMGLVKATAHAKVLNLSSNLGALLVLGIGGKVLWPLGLLMAISSSAGGRLGAHLTLRAGTRLIRPMLVTMSLLLTAKLLMGVGDWLSSLFAS